MLNYALLKLEHTDLKWFTLACFLMFCSVNRDFTFTLTRWFRDFRFQMNLKDSDTSFCRDFFHLPVPVFCALRHSVICFCLTGAHARSRLMSLCAGVQFLLWIFYTVCAFVFREWMCACSMSNESVLVCVTVSHDKAPLLNIIKGVWAVSETLLMPHYDRTEVTLKLSSLVEVQLLYYIYLIGSEYLKNVCVVVVIWINWALHWLVVKDITVSCRILGFKHFVDFVWPHYWNANEDDSDHFLQ